MNELKEFKGKNPSLPILGLPDKPGTMGHDKYIEEILDYVILEYKRRDLMCSLLEEKNGSKEKNLVKNPIS